LLWYGGILEAQYLAIEDKSSVDVNPHFFGAAILLPFVPISLGAPLTLFYRKLWKQPIYFLEVVLYCIDSFLAGIYSLFGVVGIFAGFLDLFHCRFSLRFS
jgi:hypothetical protein